MQNPALSKLIQFSIFLLAVLMYWEYQDAQDFKKAFRVENGQLVPPVAVTDVSDFLYINGEGFRKMRESLSRDSWKANLDSILAPIRQNQLTALNDTFPEVTEEVWNDFVEYFDQKAIKLDTFLLKGRRDTLWLKIEQASVFKADYIFGLKDRPFEFNVDIERTKWYTDEMLDTLPRSEQIEIIKKSDFDIPMKYSDFERHVQMVDEILEDQNVIKISFRDNRDDHRKALTEGRNIKARSHLIEKTNGRNLYKYESGFDYLASMETYMSWWDSIFHQIIFWFFVLVWLYLAFSAYSVNVYLKNQEASLTNDENSQEPDEKNL